MYINKVNELSQEFYYAHPLTKIRINNIFNSYFYGSAVWDLFGDEAMRLEKTWNVSQRIMLGLPRNAHRYFLEPLSETAHIKFSLSKRYMRFIESIETSPKSTLKGVLSAIKYECRSTTGKNLREIMKMTGKSSVDDIRTEDFNGLNYIEIPDGDAWKVLFAEELIEIKNGIIKVDDFTPEEINDILTDVVT